MSKVNAFDQIWVNADAGKNIRCISPTNLGRTAFLCHSEAIVNDIDETLACVTANRIEQIDIFWPPFPSIKDERDGWTPGLLAFECGAF